MRTMPNIAREWGISDAEMADTLGLDAETYRTWSNAPSQAVLEPEQYERVSLILGIYKALVTLFPLTDRQRRWIHQPNKAALFQGASPIDCLRHGGLAKLQAVRQYLGAECQGGFA